MVAFAWPFPVASLRAQRLTVRYSHHMAEFDDVTSPPPSRLDRWTFTFLILCFLGVPFGVLAWVGSWLAFAMICVFTLGVLFGWLMFALLTANDV